MIPLSGFLHLSKPWSWKKDVFPKHFYLSDKLQGITSRRTYSWQSSALINSNLRLEDIFICNLKICNHYDYKRSGIILMNEWYKSNETPTWCNTVQVLFLQGHSTCFGRKRPSSVVFKTGTAATGTCVIVAGQSSHLLIRAGTECFASLQSIQFRP